MIYIISIMGNFKRSWTAFKESFGDFLKNCSSIPIMRRLKYAHFDTYNMAPVYISNEEKYPHIICKSKAEFNLIIYFSVTWSKIYIDKTIKNNKK